MLSSTKLVRLTIVLAGNCARPAIAALKVPTIQALLGKEKKKTLPGNLDKSFILGPTKQKKKYHPGQSPA